MNNCATCEYKNHPDGGWCYMFKKEPQERCRKHSPFVPSVNLAPESIEGMDDMADNMEWIIRSL